MILYLIYDFFVSFFIHAWRTINFFSLFLDDGGDSAYDGKEELQRLDILSMERSQFIVKHNQMSLMIVMMMCTLKLLVECYYLMFI